MGALGAIEVYGEGRGAREVITPIGDGGGPETPPKMEVRRRGGDARAVPEGWAG